MLLFFRTQPRSSGTSPLPRRFACVQAVKRPRGPLRVFKTPNFSARSSEWRGRAALRAGRRENNFVWEHNGSSCHQRFRGSTRNAAARSRTNADERQAVCCCWLPARSQQRPQLPAASRLPFCFSAPGCHPAVPAGWQKSPAES